MNTIAVHVRTKEMNAPADYNYTTYYKSYSLDHLGLVAGLYDDLGIGQHIDELVPQDLEQRNVSIGTAVKAMIINGLGFTNRALYLMPHFFEDKPIERLLGQGIKAEYLNDDMLGRVLDDLYDYDVTRLYSQIAIPCIQQLGLDGQKAHIDSTGFHIDGNVNSGHPPDDPNVIHVTRGYSRDHRPDLNQVSLQLIVEQQAGIPMLMRALSGNSVDTVAFNETLNNHINQFDTDFKIEYLMGDAALYTKDNLQAMTDCYWISRVPRSLKSSKEVIDLFAEELSKKQEKQSIICVESHYAGVKQRWLVIYSRELEEKARHSVLKQMLKQKKSREKILARLSKQKFVTKSDAEKALEAFSDTLNGMEIININIGEIPYYEKAGRPKKGQKPDGIRYTITGELSLLNEEYEKRVQQKSCLIYATNQMDSKVLSNEELIENYRNQHKVERGFRFLKDPLFHASTVFLKLPKRIMALMMIMTLCLLVYAALEHRIRQSLQQANETFPDQQGKGTAKPTARWVFQFFTGIHLLVIDEMTSFVLNLNEYHRLLLNLLGENYMNFYSDG